MTGDEFEERLKTAMGGVPGWKTRFCEATGIAVSTLRRWTSGELALPEYAVAMLELLERVPSAFRPARWLR